MPTKRALIVATPGFKFIAPQPQELGAAPGFAYRINEKTVFRGGGGIYYNPNQTNSYTFLNTNPPWSPIFQCNWSLGTSAAQSVQSVWQCRRPARFPAATAAL